MELMFQWVLQLHSYWTLLVFLITIFVILNCSLSLVIKKKFKTFDLRLSLYALIFNHIQLIIGLVLYFISPKFSWWSNGFKSVIHNIEHRLYLIEQPITNLLGVIILTLGWSLHKKSSESSKKFLRIGVFYLLGFISISSKVYW
jgi:hypothetical protein|tara:strand:- start:1665 stop:2096 length:432 start_codon:yes stop_codon:yes gene_type:complete